MRRNQRPIFIVAFTRGGSNILLNLLRSHPDVVAARGELQQVFRGKEGDPRATVLRKRLDYLPIALAERRHVMKVSDWSERAPFGAFAAARLDAVLWGDRFRDRPDRHALEKREGVPYTRDEIGAARLVIKNVDGLIFLSRALAGIFPDATFVALVRNGYAVCEGHARRGASLENAAEHYRLGVGRMLEDAERLPRYRIVRYEDLIDPGAGALETLLEHCELDPARLTRVRLETKRVVGADGGHRAVGAADGAKRGLWFDVGEHFEHFVPEANARQIARLDAGQRETVRACCGTVLERFGYGLDDGPRGVLDGAREGAGT